MRIFHLREIGRLSALLLVLCSSITVLGQAATTGSLAGTVTDPAGGVISGTVIVIVEQASGTTYTATSSGSGSYVIPAVRPGTYTEAVTAPGFSRSETKGISVFVGTRAAQDVKLALGSASDTVSVSSSGPSLELESSDIGTVLTSHQVEDLPIAVGGAFRSLQTLSFLAPGAVGPGTTGGVFQ